MRIRRAHRRALNVKYVENVSILLSVVKAELRRLSVGEFQSVPDRQAGHRKTPAGTRAESVTRNDEKTTRTTTTGRIAVQTCRVHRIRSPCSFMVVVDDSCLKQADSQPKSEGRRPLGAALHSPDEPSELSQ